MIVMKIFMIGLNAEQGERIYMKYSVYVRKMCIRDRHMVFTFLKEQNL